MGQWDGGALFRQGAPFPFPARESGFFDFPGLGAAAMVAAGEWFKSSFGR